MTGKWYDCNDGRRYIVETRVINKIPYGVLVDVVVKTAGPETPVASIAAMMPYSDVTPGKGPVPSDAKAVADASDVTLAAPAEGAA